MHRKKKGKQEKKIQMAGETDEAGPVPLVLDLRITHDRFGCSSDPSLNGNLHYPNNIDRSLNETTDDKIRKYHSDYNINPPNTVSFMFVVTSTSGRSHSEFVNLLFLQAHRETDRFFAVSDLKIRVGLTLSKASSLRITLNLDGTPITSR